jgi:hypothetical protein
MFLFITGAVCVCFVVFVAIAIGMAARGLAVPRSSTWYWPSVLTGALGDILVGFMMGMVITGFTLSPMRYFVNVELPSANPPLLPHPYLSFWIVAAICALGFRWLRRRWTRLPNRAFATFMICVIAAMLLHFAFVENGDALLYPSNLPPTHAWFAWCSDQYPNATLWWFAPRFPTIPYGGSVCSSLGIIAPTALLGVGVLLIFRAVKHGGGALENNDPCGNMAQGVK